MLFLSFRASLSLLASSRPICLFLGPVIHYSYHLGLMVLLSALSILCCPCYWAFFLSTWILTNGPQQLPKQVFLEAVFLNNMDHDCIAFHIKILEKSRFNEETCNPPSLARVPIWKSLPRTMFPTYCKGEAKLSTEGRLVLQLERGVLTTRLQLLNSVWRRTWEDSRELKILWCYWLLH